MAMQYSAWPPVWHKTAGETEIFPGFLLRLCGNNDVSQPWLRAIRKAVNGHAIYCGNVRRWQGVGAASPDEGHGCPVLRMRKIPGWVSKGNPLARDCIQSVTCPGFPRSPGYAGLSPDRHAGSASGRQFCSASATRIPGGH